MSQESPRVGLPYLMPSQAQKHVTHNEALQRLDAVTQLVVQGFEEETPPALPAQGDVHSLGASPNGAWAGQSGKLAYWNGTAWLFLAPSEGWRAWGIAEQELRIWNSGTWQTAAATTLLQNIELLGVNTTAEPANPLSVAGHSTLFTHEGAGHQLKLNKATLTDTASLLFQSGWSGRAEMGLAGQDDWSIKVSQDGSSWTTALQIAAATGHANGEAVQASPKDATIGRLLKVGAFGLGGSMIEFSGDIDDPSEMPSGFYRITGSATGTKPDGLGAFNLVQIRRGGAAPFSNTTQIVSAGAKLLTRDGGTSGWSDWSSPQFTQDNILGTVSQSGGTPTGAVIEPGSNANGEYVRFADGTQICIGEVTLDYVGGFGCNATWSFPANFAAGSSSSIAVAQTIMQASGSYTPSIEELTGGDLGTLSITECQLRVRRISGLTNFQSGDTVLVRATAIGRWF